MSATGVGKLYVWRVSKVTIVYAPGIIQLVESTNGVAPMLNAHYVRGGPLFYNKAKGTQGTTCRTYDLAKVFRDGKCEPANEVALKLTARYVRGRPLFHNIQGTRDLRDNHAV
jgi:hypothetical protein